MIRTEFVNEKNEKFEWNTTDFSRNAWEVSLEASMYKNTPRMKYKNHLIGIFAKNSSKSKLLKILNHVILRETNVHILKKKKSKCNY